MLRSAPSEPAARGFSDLQWEWNLTESLLPSADRAPLTPCMRSIEPAHKTDNSYKCVKNSRPLVTRLVGAGLLLQFASGYARS